MFNKTILASLCTAFLVMTSNLPADTTGKVDVGLTHLEIDIINNGDKVRNISTWGLGANGTMSVYKALVVKPSLILTENEANYFSAGLATGFYIPVMDCVAITPAIGGSYSWLRFNIDLPQYGKFDQRQRFLSRSFNVGFDACWTVIDCVSLSFGLQYAWVNTHTTIGNFVSYRGSSRGFNYIGMIDYWLGECWSVNLTVGFQESRDKEKHGSDAVGIRAGLGFLF